MKPNLLTTCTEYLVLVVINVNRINLSIAQLVNFSYKSVFENCESLKFTKSQFNDLYNVPVLINKLITWKLLIYVGKYFIKTVMQF